MVSLAGYLKRVPLILKVHNIMFNSSLISISLNPPLNLVIPEPNIGTVTLFERKPYLSHSKNLEESLYIQSLLIELRSSD